MNPVTIIEGDGPILLGQPHCSVYLPPDIEVCLNARGRLLADTDWHVDRLYDGLINDASIVRANFHRYVIDANRSPADETLYKNANTTSLVPLTDFDGEPIWNEPPTAAEIEKRIKEFHTPYHRAIEDALQRIKEKHGFAILFDCHSIRSTIPFLFEGRLPDLNVGTNDGATCAPQLERAVMTACEEMEDVTSVLNGRFKGGWTTRHYGRPGENLHAIQLELSQALYLETEEPPFSYDTIKAEILRRPLRSILTALIESATNHLPKE